MTEAELKAHWWNTNFPEGVSVRYWPGMRDGNGIVSSTRSPAQVMHDCAVVWVVGRSDCIALTHVEPLTSDIGTVTTTPQSE